MTMIDRWHANGARSTSAFVHFKVRYSEDDMWNQRQAILCDANGHPYTIGLRTSCDDMMFDMEVAAMHRAVVVYVEWNLFFYKRQQAIKAIDVVYEQMAK